MSFTDYLTLKRVVDTLYDVQKTRIASENRMKRTMPRVSADIGGLKKIEDQLEKDLNTILKDVPIYTSWIKGVKGVGPRLAAYIISKTMIKFKTVTEEELHDGDYAFEQIDLAEKTMDGKYKVPCERGIGAFNTISKYWTWLGLGVIDGEAARRKAGQKANYCTDMKAVNWKLGKQFVMQGVIYRVHYDRYKKRLTEARTPPEKCPAYNKNRICKVVIKKGNPPPCKMHIHNMAMRYAAKQFYLDLWINWRILEGLPISDAYVIAVLKHEKRERESHSVNETQEPLASHRRHEIQQKVASQHKDETHDKAASHTGI